VFDDGDGNYRIYQIAGQTLAKERGVPRGSLFPLPDAPGFETAKDANKWIRNSGDALQGLQVALMKGVDIMSIEVESRPRVVVKTKPKKPVER